MRTPLRTLLSVTAVAAVAIGTVLVAPAGAWAAENPNPPATVCTRYVVPVTLASGSTTTYNLVGRLCKPTFSSRNTTIEVLIHGFTYDHYYWDIPYQPLAYSHVYHASVFGWSTFNIDRLGVGESDKPAAALLTTQSEAYVLQQVIKKLRTGTIDGTSYQKVVGVGHSYGAAIAQYAAATTTDPLASPNYLVLEDFLTTTYDPGLLPFRSSLIPAASDPKFASAGLPAGYLTAVAGTRPVLYNTAVADPALIALDESLKQTGTTAELATLPDAKASTITHGVHVPTLIVTGQYDSFYCNVAAGLPCTNRAAVLAREGANFSPTACLDAYAVTDAGHSVNLHPKALELYNAINTWLNNYIVNYAGQLTPNGCLPV